MIELRDPKVFLPYIPSLPACKRPNPRARGSDIGQGALRPDPFARASRPGSPDHPLSRPGHAASREHPFASTEDLLLEPEWSITPTARSTTVPSRLIYTKRHRGISPIAEEPAGAFLCGPGGSSDGGACTVM